MGPEEESPPAATTPAPEATTPAPETTTPAPEATTSAAEQHDSPQQPHQPHCSHADAQCSTDLPVFTIVFTGDGFLVLKHLSYYVLVVRVAEDGFEDLHQRQAGYIPFLFASGMLLGHAGWLIQCSCACCLHVASEILHVIPCTQAKTTQPTCKPTAPSGLRYWTRSELVHPSRWSRTEGLFGPESSS